MEKVILSPIPLEELRDVICESVKAEFTRQFESLPKQNQDNDLITRKEAACFLGISLPTLLDFTKAGKVIGYRIGTRVRYKRSELEQSLQQIRSIKYKRG